MERVIGGNPEFSVLVVVDSLMVCCASTEGSGKAMPSKTADRLKKTRRNIIFLLGLMPESHMPFKQCPNFNRIFEWWCVCTGKMRGMAVESTSSVAVANAHSVAAYRHCSMQAIMQALLKN